MSLYNCLAIIHEQFDLEQHSHANNLQALIDAIKQIMRDDSYDQLDQVIQQATHLLDEISNAANIHKSEITALGQVLGLLKGVKARRDDQDNPGRLSTDSLAAVCHRLDLSLAQFLVLPFAQVADFRTGVEFSGACFGLCHIYTNWRFQQRGAFNEWQSLLPELKLSWPVCMAQLKQNQRGYIGKTVLSAYPKIIKVVASDDRVSVLIDSLVKYPSGSELSIGLYESDFFSTRGHELRISYDRSGRYYLFEPNMGVFCFSSLPQLAAGFADLMKIYENRLTPICYSVIEVATLTPSNGAYIKQITHSIQHDMVAMANLIVSSIIQLWSLASAVMTVMLSVLVDSGLKCIFDPPKTHGMHTVFGNSGRQLPLVENENHDNRVEVVSSFVSPV